jgi:hypothetical protein
MAKSKPESCFFDAGTCHMTVVVWGTGDLKFEEFEVNAELSRPSCHDIKKAATFKHGKRLFLGPLRPTNLLTTVKLRVPFNYVVSEIGIKK